MLSEEEKKAIEFIKFYQQYCLKKEKENMKQYETVNDEEFASKNLDTVLNLITKLQKENELAKEQLKKQCEIADERNDLLVKVQELQKENKEKDKEIDLLINKLNQNYNKVFESNEVKEIIEIYEKIKNKNKLGGLELRKECIKQYFEKLAKEDK